MRRIVESSLKLRRLVIALALGLVVLGITRLGSTPTDLLPEFDPPTVEVQTEALGLSAPEVEQLVTVPLEQDLLNGVAFLERIESASLPGLSSIVMTFEAGTDLLDARQVVQERLTQAVGAAGLPQVARPPQMLQPRSSTSRVSIIRLSSTELSPIEMSVLARWIVVPRLLGVEGVANVAVWGQRERQLQVLVDPERLQEREVRLLDVIRTTGNALEVSALSFLEASSPGTGGFIDTVNQRLHIFHEQAITTPEELAQVTLEDAEGHAMFVDGAPLTLGQVSDVVEDHQPLIGDALCSDGPCLLLVAEKSPGANTLQVTHGIEDALAALRPGLGATEIDSTVYRPATYIGDAFSRLAVALAIGGVLLLVTVLLLLWSWRRALIVVASLALSAVAAALVLNLWGTTVNVMVVAGLVMALGVLVHDAVHDVHQLGRRLEDHPPGDGGPPVGRVIAEASTELRGSLLVGTLIVAAAMIPAFLLEGAAGAFLPPIALSYLLAAAVSTVVALTVTPALAMVLLAGRPPSRPSAAAAWLAARHRRAIDGLAGRPVVAMSALAVTAAVGLATVPFLDGSLSPGLRERDLVIELEAPPGTSLPRMDAITAQAVDDLSLVPGIRDVGAHVGRAVTSDQVVNVNSGEVWLSIDRAADYDATLERIDAVVGRYRDLDVDVMTYSTARADDGLAGSDDDLTVRMFGEDPNVLRAKAEEVRDLLAGIDGVEPHDVEVEAEEPGLEIEVDLARARSFGVKPGDVHRAAATLLSGLTVGNLFDEQKVFDVVVWGRPDIRQDPQDVQELLIDTPGGPPVRLDQVADIRLASSPTVIRHEAVSSFVDVTADVTGDARTVTADVREALRGVTFPLDHHAEVLDGILDRQGARTRALAVAAAVAIGIFLLLQAAFSSWRLAALAFLTLPAALAGGAVGALLAGGSFGLGSVAGLLAVLGVAAGNAVVLIRRWQHLQRREGFALGRELVERGGGELLLPVLTAAVATVALLLPLVLAGSTTGLEIVRPMAVVVIGGLVVSTLVELLVLPVLYLRFGATATEEAWSEDLLLASDAERVHG
jgi:Cu/Ag efflux pump CusA